jgi:hypothetical protein
VSESSAGEDEVAVAVGKLKSYKSLGVVRIPAEHIQIQAGGGTLHSDIHNLVQVDLEQRRITHLRKELIVAPIHKRVLKLTAVFILTPIVVNFIKKITQMKEALSGRMGLEWFLGCAGGGWWSGYCR